LKTKTSGRNSFTGLNERQVLGQVGRFGEEIAAALLDGEMVSDHSEQTPFADVVNRKIDLAVQVKMCNGRHAQRPLPKQVIDLFKEIEQPFLFNKGVYTFIFYNGVHSYKSGHPGKSKLWSRKFSRGMRREIIAHELQYVYILDVRLLRYLTDCPEFLKEGANLYVPEEKPNRGKVLYLNRTFMKGFKEMRESHRKLLDTALGRGKWDVEAITRKFRFTGGVEGLLERKISVHIVGSKQTVRAVMSVLDDRLAPIPLEHTKTADMFAVKPPRF
jgi:hypothetical protein